MDGCVSTCEHGGEGVGLSPTAARYIYRPPQVATQGSGVETHRGVGTCMRDSRTRASSRRSCEGRCQFVGCRYRQGRLLGLLRGFLLGLLEGWGCCERLGRVLGGPASTAVVASTPALLAGHIYIYMCWKWENQKFWGLRRTCSAKSKFVFCERQRHQQDGI